MKNESKPIKSQDYKLEAPVNYLFERRIKMYFLLQVNVLHKRKIITGRNEVVAKVIFLQACVCPRGGVLSPGGGVLSPGGILSPGGCT